MTSADVTLADSVHDVVDLAVCVKVSDGWVISFAWQNQPFGAVGRLIMGTHTVCPAVNDPVVAPPVNDPGVPQPEAIVKVVPFDTRPLAAAKPRTSRVANGTVVPMPTDPALMLISGVEEKVALVALV